MLPKWYTFPALSWELEQKEQYVSNKIKHTFNEVRIQF